MAYIYGNSVTKTWSGYTRTWRTYVNYSVKETPTTYEITTEAGINCTGTGSAEFKSGKVTGSASGLRTDSTTNAGYHKFESGTSSNARYWKIFGSKTVKYNKATTPQNKAITVKFVTASGYAWAGTSTLNYTFVVPALTDAPSVTMTASRRLDESANLANIELSVSSATSMNVGSVDIFVDGVQKTPTVDWVDDDGDTVTFPFAISSEEKNIYLVNFDTETYPTESPELKVNVNAGSLVGSTTYELPNTYDTNWSSPTVEFSSDELPDILSNGNANVVLEMLVNGAWVEIPNSGGYSITQTSSGFSLKFNVDESILGSHAVSQNIEVRAKYVKTESGEDKNNLAIYKTTRNANYSTGLANNIWLSGCELNDFTSRAWYSEANNPLYIPDQNFIEVGSTDKKIMGLSKVGDYLGIIKQGSTTDTSIYLAYPTSFDDKTTFAIKQEVSGIGANSKYCFNVLNGETLFLSKDGVMAICPSANDSYKTQNRSFYINKLIANEESTDCAYSFSFKNLYILSFGNNCYVLDGSQKNSWANDRSNLQYEAYYWDNIPAKCFAECNGALWFTDGENLCRFKSEDRDFEFTYSDETSKTNKNGVPIEAEWSTIMDDDSAVHYFKNLQKKGCVVSIMPVKPTSAEIYIKKDELEEEYIGELVPTAPNYPVDFYLHKKIKKYKRLQIIVRNSKLNEGFGVDQIVKQYTIGNYSK